MSWSPAKPGEALDGYILADEADESGSEGVCAYLLLPVRVPPCVLLIPDDAAARVTDETADEPRMRLPLVPGRGATAKGRS